MRNKEEPRINTDNADQARENEEEMVIKAEGRTQGPKCVVFLAPEGATECSQGWSVAQPLAECRRLRNTYSASVL
ncbi:hypothetical protein VT84_07130 [Gemmata sp. SH-PL17]|nr:hypothetical protein VT84_07130 [Gemmata sp. SH-PL17]